MSEPQPYHRPIRSFVLRGGRITPAQRRAFDELWPRFGVDWSPGQSLDSPALFGNCNPVYAEIGFGNGECLAELASRNPQRNYLGIEVHRPGAGHLLLEIERRGLTNVRVCRHDAVEVLERGVERASLAGVYLFFPDPWPKQRHHKRRILNLGFVHLLAQVLRPGGVFHTATDWEPYALQMLELFENAGELFENAAGSGNFSPRSQDRPLTRFERRGEYLGHRVRDLVFYRR